MTHCQGCFGIMAWRPRTAHWIMNEKGEFVLAFTNGKVWHGYCLRKKLDNDYVKSKKENAIKY